MDVEFRCCLHSIVEKDRFLLPLALVLIKRGVVTMKIQFQATMLLIFLVLEIIAALDNEDRDEYTPYSNNRLISSSSSPSFSKKENWILAITSIASSLLSLVGSSCILSIIVRDHKRKLKKTYHRLLLMLSLSDTMNSLRGVVSPFLIPSDTPGAFGAAIGTQGTCTGLGFSVQLGLMSAFYSASLAIYFFLIVQPKIQPTIISTFVEPILHIISISYPLGSAIAGLPLTLYNPTENGVGCWITPYPWGCLDDNSCVRGEKAQQLLTVLGAVPLFVIFAFILAMMGGLYYSVWKQTRNMTKRYNVVVGGGQRGRGRRRQQQQQQVNTAIISRNAEKRLRQTRTQAGLYVLAFLLTYLLVGILRRIESSGSNDNDLFALAVVSTLFFPLQGFWNFFIYVRPRFIDLRAQYPNEKPFQIMKRILELRKPNNNQNKRFSTASSTTNRKQEGTYNNHTEDSTKATYPSSRRDDQILTSNNDIERCDKQGYNEYVNDEIIVDDTVDDDSYDVSCFIPLAVERSSNTSNKSHRRTCSSGGLEQLAPPKRKTYDDDDDDEHEEEEDEAPSIIAEVATDMVPG